ncbi:hypothetical protein I4U23_003739 [Adineta vaga]|nr:hypothetical protein I4U23_003739 [Adineta vaga]
MNQIIHKYAQLNDENSIIDHVIEHINWIMLSVRPNQLVYIAMDGVTPRTRMPCQRMNRFLKSKNISDGLKEKFTTNDQHELTTEETFDKCHIKPGAKFMCKLSKYLHSDSDLVLLGSLTHEQNLTIICDVCANCEESGHDTKDCDTKKSSSTITTTTTANNEATKYAVIYLSKLINYFKLQKYDSSLFARKYERFIDDWVHHRGIGIYYDQHYAPLAYDFSNLRNVSSNFDSNTKPVRPFEQMLVTFSPENKEFLPPEWQPLMSKDDPHLGKFFPKNFNVDPDGKKRSSQYIALIPFMDENSLLVALQSINYTLTEDEEKRNRLDYDRLLVHSRNPIYQKFRKLNGNSDKLVIEENPIQLSQIENSQLVGHVWLNNDDDLDEEAMQSLPIRYQDRSRDQIIVLKYCICSFRNKHADNVDHNSVRFQSTAN